MLFLQFMLYSSSFVGTLIKNEIPEAAMELCLLKIKQLSPNILKFRTKHIFLVILHAGPRGLGSNNFRNSSYKEKTAGSARVSRLSFRFLWLWLYLNVPSSHLLIESEICLKLLIKNPEERPWHSSGVFILSFEHISRIALVFPLLNLNK